MYLPDVPNIYLGDSGVTSIYLGDTLVWPVNDDYYEEMYVTVDITSGGTLNFGSVYNLDYQSHYTTRNHLYYSINGEPWISSRETAYSIAVSEGDTVRLKGNISDRSTAIYDIPWSPSFSGSTASFNVFGNALSLIYGDSFTGQTGITDTYAFAHLFELTNVVSAKHFLLPKGTYPLYTMFEMFYGCPLLEYAPVIRADAGNIRDGYDNARTEAFCNCPNLKYVECRLRSTGSARRWMRNVARTGTFIKRAGAAYPTGEDGIPSGWTVIEKNFN